MTIRVPYPLLRAADTKRFKIDWLLAETLRVFEELGVPKAN